MIGGTGKAIIQAMLLGPVLSTSGNKKLGILAHEPNKDLAFLKQLFEEGKVRPVIDRVYKLEELPTAMRYFSEGRAGGKVVISI